MSDWHPEEAVYQERWENEPVRPLYYKFLQGRIFHRTNVVGFKGIQDTGYIIPNKGQFPYNHTQSPHYFGGRNHLVCLFDFSSGTEREHILQVGTWGFFFWADFKPVTIVIELNQQKLQAKLVPNSVAQAKKMEEKWPVDRDKAWSYIPYVEAWYPEPIPVSAISSYMLVFHPAYFQDFSYEFFSVDQTQELLDLITEIQDEFDRLQSTSPDNKA